MTTHRDPSQHRRLARIAELAYRRRGRVILAWIAALAVTAALAPRLAGEFEADYATPGTESQAAADLVGRLETFDRKLASGGEQGRMFPTLGVEMRPPEVFVRELAPEEGARLKSISKRAKYQSKRQRAMILLASSTGMPAPEIARLVRSDESHVRKVIHAFNEEGFSSLDPDYRGGRPKKLTPAQRDRVVAVARARPDSQGVALTRWSTAKLADVLAGQGLALSATALRALLDDAGLSFQRTRSWKWSPDPDFAEKAERVLSLYRDPPADGPVVCFGRPPR